MANFIFYIVASEWIQLGSGFLHLRGSLISGDFQPGGVECVEPVSGQRLKISGEGLLPSRPGEPLKMLSAAMRERVFTSKDKPSECLNGHVLFGIEGQQKFNDYRVSIERCNVSPEGSESLHDFVYPITIAEFAALGLLFFEDGRPTLKVFSSQSLSGKLELHLLNSVSMAGPAFEVEIDRQP